LGGGGFLAELIKYPGSSALINNISIPYNSDAFIKANNIVTTKIVSQETNEKIVEKFRDNFYITVVVNASLTTNRIRKGKNEAYLAIDIPGKSCFYEHIRFSKFTEEKDYTDYLEKRADEDFELSCWIIDQLRKHNETD
jgi:nicotinamide mononucleotide (NMN) deamidase PncC